MDIIVIEKAVSWHSTVFQYLLIVFLNMKFYLFIFLTEQHIFYIEIFLIFLISHLSNYSSLIFLVHLCNFKYLLFAVFLLSYLL